MARRPRIAGQQLHHHIYAWGNNRQAIFLTDRNYQRYLDLLEIYSRDCLVDVVAYCLLQSHVHLFVFDSPGKLSQFMTSLHGEYARYYNSVTGHIGHVFGERYNNKVVQANVYGLWLSRYIHRQAVEANLVADPKEYRWSSYQAYLGEIPLGFVKPDVILNQFGTGGERVGQYGAFVVGSSNCPIDWGTKSGAIVGDEAFQLEVRQTKNAGDPEDLSDQEALSLVAEYFAVKPELLMAAHGLHEKRLRREAIKYLIDEVRLRPARIAKLLHISRSGVQRALNTRV